LLLDPEQKTIYILYSFAKIAYIYQGFLAIVLLDGCLMEIGA
jgi:hypothetical protein